VQTKIRRLAVATGAVLLVLALGGFRYSGFGDAAGKAAAADGTAYLKSRQLPRGSFEVAGFPGFETPDAVLAIAENAQTTAKWNKAEARNAVYATKNGDNSVLHAVDDYADGGLTAGQAAKLIMLVTRPLGLSPTRFNPDKDTPVNLRAILDGGLQPDGSYGAFNATLYAAIAKRVLGGVPPQTLAYIRAAQEPGGGWNFAGDPTGAAAPADVDTTALAIQALIASRVPKGDTDVRQGLAFLASSHQGSGAWQSFGSDDPNSTSLAIVAITAAGYDPTVPCWRNMTAPALRNAPYTSPVTWLKGDQLPSGRFLSPNDSFGINTFPTSQSIQALRRGWLPVNTLAKQKCA
jgi:hypothetical protein